MKTENELNREYAEELSMLMLENPTLRVIAWIYSEGISDDYAFWGGNLDKPCLETIAYSNITEHYCRRDGNDWEDCMEYYGSDADYWDDETLAKKANAIPWEEVITVGVSVV